MARRIAEPLNLLCEIEEMSTENPNTLIIQQRVQ